MSINLLTFRTYSWLSDQLIILKKDMATTKKYIKQTHHLEIQKAYLSIFVSQLRTRDHIIAEISKRADWIITEKLLNDLNMPGWSIGPKEIAP